MSKKKITDYIEAKPKKVALTVDLDEELYKKIAEAKSIIVHNETGKEITWVDFVSALFRRFLEKEAL